jgi:multiple sugar transport system permease protein
MIFPFIWMILTGFKSFGESILIPPTFLPKEWHFENFQTAWKALPFGNLYLNTLLLMFWRIVCAVIFSAMAAYGFARIEFKGRELVFSIVLIQMMLPAQIFIIPQYLMVAKLHWLNSIKALVFPGLVSAFGTFLLRQFYKGIPKELEEAAILDGCNHWGIFWKIMFPLSKNNLIALGIFTALFAYKDLMWPLIVNMSMDMMTLSAGIASFKGQYTTNYPIIMACSFIAMWPMLILYVLFQKQFIEGITFTGSKG